MRAYVTLGICHSGKCFVGTYQHKDTTGNREERSITKATRNKNGKKQFTQEQIEAADSVQIEGILHSHGIEPRRCGSELHWRREGEWSISITGSKWYCYYSGEGGGAIAFAMKFFNKDFKDAVRFLLEKQTGQLPQRVCSLLPRDSLSAPEKDTSHNLVWNYLTQKRMIAPDIVQHFINAGAIYQSKERDEKTGVVHRNLVFLGTDREGKARQAHVKGMLEKAFRYDADGSQKEYGFCHVGQSKRLFVFEAAIDLMSFLTLYPNDWQRHSYLSLNGTAECALLQFLADVPNIEKVYLLLDHDAGGIEAVRRLTDILTEKTKTELCVRLPTYKDWNAQLKSKHGLPAEAAQEHPQLFRLQQIAKQVCEMSEQVDPRYATANHVEDILAAAQAGQNQKGNLEKAAAILLSNVRMLMARAESPVSTEQIARGVCREYRPHKERIKESTRWARLLSEAHNAVEQEKSFPTRTTEQLQQAAKETLCFAMQVLAAEVALIPSCEIEHTDSDEKYEEGMRLDY